MNDVQIYHYSLKLNKYSNIPKPKISKGALIKINGGVGCIHPCPQLGDLKIEDQIKLLKKSKKTPLIQRALECAKVDSMARLNKESLFKNYTQPNNHRLVLSNDDPKYLRKEGYKSVKFKINPKQIDSINLKLKTWEESGFIIRLDANESFSWQEINALWNNLDSNIKKKIEFIEDPIKNEDFEKINTQIPIAIDRDILNKGKYANILIWKPAYFSFNQINNFLENSDKKYSIVITSYLDHPIGQLWASYNAHLFKLSKWSKLLLDCGILSHHYFKKNKFSKNLKVEKTKFKLPVKNNDTGLGFNKILGSIKWENLFK